MKTTILTAMLAVSVMGAENVNLTNLIGPHVTLYTPQGYHWEVDESHRTEKTMFNADCRMKLVPDAANATYHGGYPGQPDVGLTNISAATVTNLNAALLEGDLPTTPRINMATNAITLVTNRLAADIISATRATNIVLSAEQVRYVCASGQICKVVGHLWEGLPHVTLEYRPDGNYPMHRQCRLCGKQQTYSAEWRD